MPLPQITFTEPIGPTASKDTDPADAPLLVLAPSLGTSTMLWELVIPTLAERYRVTAWDLPGHGASPAATAPFTVAELADAVAEAMCGFGVERTFYAGVSLGGAVGLELLLRHPDLVTAAAIIASGAKIGEPQIWSERAQRTLSETTSTFVDASTERWFAPGSLRREPLLTDKLLQGLRDTNDESYALASRAVGGHDVRARLGEIAAPVLAIWGRYDPVTPESLAAEIASGVQHGSSQVIEDAAHLPPAERPAEIAAILLNFFDRALSTTPSS